MDIKRAPVDRGAVDVTMAMTRVFLLNLVNLISLLDRPEGDFDIVMP